MMGPGRRAPAARLADAATDLSKLYADSFVSVYDRFPGRSGRILCDTVPSPSGARCSLAAVVERRQEQGCDLGQPTADN